MPYFFDPFEVRRVVIARGILLDVPSTNRLTTIRSRLRERLMSLHGRISFALLVLSVPALIFVGVLGYQGQMQDADRIRSAASRSLDGIVRELDGELLAAHSLLEVLARTPAIANKNVHECERLFAELLKTNQRYVNISLVDLKGNLVCSGVPATTVVNFKDHIWFKQAVATKNFFVGTYQIGQITGKASLGLGHPTYDAQGNVTGVVFAGLDLNALNLRLQDIMLPVGEEATLVDRDGTILMHLPNPSTVIGTPIVQNTATIQMMKNPRGALDVRTADGRTQSYEYASVGDEWSAGLNAIMRFDVASELSATTRLTDSVLLIGVIAVLLTLLFVNRLVNRIVVRPLEQLTLTAERMQENFSVRIALPDRKDEIYELSKTLNEAFETVEASVQQLRVRDAQLTAQSQQRMVVSEVNRIMARSRNPQTLFEDICRVLVERGAFTFAWVALVNEADHRLDVGAKWGNDDGYIQSRVFDLNDPKDPAAIVMKSGIPTVFNDIATEPRLEKVRDVLLKRSIRSAAWFPFKNEAGKTVGGIAFYAPKPGAFTEEIIRLYEEVAQDVGFAIQAMENVTRRTQAEGRAAESETRLTNVLELTPDAIAVVRDGAFVYTNRKAAEILGTKTAEALRGTAFLPFVPEEQRQGIADRLKMLRAEKREPAFEIVIRRPDGSETPVEATMAFYLFEKSPAAILVFRDITERKQSEKQIASLNDLRNTFIHVISHQLRTPLNAIRWHLESLLSGDLGKLEKSQEQTLEAVYSAEIDMLRRIHDLLAALDIEEGREAPKKEKVDFVALWTSVSETMKRECHTKGLKCEISVPRTKHPTINADREKIRQVLEVLMSNAISYTKTGGVVHVKIGSTPSTLRFEITDSGIGIPEAEQSRVFEKFFRASNATSMLPDATGLGLSIAKHFVDQHGGTMGFASKEGKGTTFWFELPVVS